MARITPIRITENDKKEYARLVRNARAKVRRMEKKYGVDLSGEVEIPKTIDEFQTRKEFNEWKEQVGSFTNRHNLTYQFEKNEYGVVASKKQINKIKRDVKKAQRIAEEEIAKHLDKPVYDRDRQWGTVKDRTIMMSEPDVLGVHRPKEFDFSRVRNPQRLKDIEESMERRAYPEYYDWRKEQMKMNFMKMLEESFNSDADDLIDELADLPPDDFYDLYLQHPREFDFNLYYPMEGEDENTGNYANDINQMLSYVKRYKAGEMNSDLKGF